jgi:uncharacterized membrane protein
MPTLESSILINHGIDDVFQYATDLTRHPEWRSGLLHAEVTTPGEVGVGTTYTYNVQVMGRKIETSGEVGTYEPPQVYGWEATSGPFPMSGTTKCEKSSEGTLVTESITVEPGGFFKLAEPLLLRQQQSQMETDLLKLKKLLENRA